MPQLDYQPLMLQALSLAIRGRGWVEPNPMVGCLIVKDGQIIGQGFHEKFGGPHAEANALASCQQSPQGATAVVTLEPCCHTNKKTPPCVPRLISAKIARVVIAATDPNPQVSGRGIEQLRQANIQIITGILQSQSQQLNAAFHCRTQHHRPYVTLKWAQTADGKVAGPLGKRMQISSPQATHAVHQLRACCDAIMVGINTVLTDDPLLTVRDVPSRRPLLRIVLDHHLRLPIGSRLVATAAENPLLVYCDASADAKSMESLRRRGVQIKPVGTHLPTVLADIHARAVTHLLVEAGPTLAANFIGAGLADRLWIIDSPKRLNDDTAPAAVPIDFPPSGRLSVGDDYLTEYLNPASAAYFAQYPSADFQLLQLAITKSV